MQTTTKLDDLWGTVKSIIRASDRFDEAVFDTYFDQTALVSMTSDHAVVMVPTYFQKLVLDAEKQTITAAFDSVVNKSVRVDIEFTEDYQTTQQNDQIPTLLFNKINPDQTFENFVTGPSNKESYMAALACTKKPGEYYNPLFIYGNSGLGKTHLMNAIANRILKERNLKVYYTSGVDFVSNITNGFVNKTFDQFRDALRQLDVFLIDDVQFLAGREKSHEVFFHLFNELVSNHKQIVITSDRHPSEIKGLEDRLISRFNSGLSVTLDAPEFETAVAILQMKIRASSLDPLLISDEALHYLAANFAKDVRSLEGALNRLYFYAIEFSGEKQINLGIAMEAFNGRQKVRKTKELNPRQIKRTVAEYYGLTTRQIEGKSRTRNIMIARHIAMYLCRKHLDLSFIKIGESFGGRDHTTVMNACSKVERNLKEDAAYQLAVREIEQMIINPA